MTSCYLCSSVRTRFGRFGGAPADVRPDDLVATALTGLARVPERWGVAAICIGVGQALAVVLENVSGGAS